MKRHGGPAASAIRQERIDGGYRGWSEIQAADGYVLRTEWSRFELRRTMNVSELPPSSAADVTAEAGSAAVAGDDP